MADGQKTIAEVAIEVALEEARRGVFEDSNDNRGQRIDEYQKAANNTTGQAWCAKFAWWCYNQAAAKLGIVNPFPRIFGAEQLELWARRQKLLVDDPALGDVLIKQQKHVGLVTGPATSGGTVPSVEGNTWSGTTYENRREGVYQLKSQRVTQCVFIRFV